jgi:hypothetical protein
MPRQDKLLEQILRGKSDANVNFGERGDHHIFTRDDIAEIINLQPVGES